MSPKAKPNPAISIIIPVFNVSIYLHECFESLLTQTFNRSFEIIFVDDCSTDNSKQQCIEFVANYPMLARLICHPENQGVSVARNSGLDIATGDYFTFVDPDDLLTPNALQYLYDAAITYKADIVKGNNLIFDETRSYTANYNVKNQQIYENEAILSVFYEHKITRGHPWGKLFHRSRFGHIRYTPGVVMAQDTLYCTEIHANASRLILIDKIVYHYRTRASGTKGRKFQTGAYLWWLYSIENCGRFASTQQQHQNFKGLQIRTLLQLTREARFLEKNQLTEVIAQIVNHQEKWKLASFISLLQQNINPKFLLYFLRFTWMLYKLKTTANLTNPHQTNRTSHKEVQAKY